MSKGWTDGGATISVLRDSMRRQPIRPALVLACLISSVQRKTARVCTTGGFCFALYPDYAAAAALRWGSFSLIRADLPLRSRR